MKFILSTYTKVLTFNNFGIVSALLSVLKREGDVQWVLVGHDHGNDWCCPSQAGLTICYGRHTGYGGYGRYIQ